MFGVVPRPDVRRGRAGGSDRPAGPNAPDRHALDRWCVRPASPGRPATPDRRAGQSARPAAPGPKRANTPKQPGLALPGSQDVKGPSPPAHDTQFQPQYYWSWLARILPHIEQDNLYRQAELWRDGGPQGNLR